MIYITGDTHAEPQKFVDDAFPEQKEMTKDDYLIVCGDFGFLWNKGESPHEKKILDWMEKKNFTILFVDGNHENFNRLNSLPVEEWHGGKVHKAREHVIHLMRGEMFEIDGLNIFSFGGAQSHDIQGLATDDMLKKDYIAGVLQQNDPHLREKLRLLDDVGRVTRIENKSWWRAEMPTEEEMQHGRDTLEKHGWKTDFVITHDGPASSIALLTGGWMAPDPLRMYFEEIRQKLDYRKWFFGHHHMDHQINAQDIVLFDQIVRVH